LETVDVDTLVQYANRMEDKSLGSRLGYLLETLDQPAEGLMKSASPVKLDVSSSRSGETDPRWQVIVNVPERSLIPQGVG
jgi:predicted transcriptional regulator of viral defense system